MGWSDGPVVPSHWLGCTAIAPTRGAERAASKFKADDSNACGHTGKGELGHAGALALVQDVRALCAEAREALGP